MTSVAVVTGAGGVIGEAISRRLATEVDALVLVDLSEDAVFRAARDVQAATATETMSIAADITTDDGVSSVLAALEQRSWSPRQLINNAGINRDARAMKMTEEQFRSVIRVDLIAPARLAFALRPHMPAGSAIVNVSSRAAFGSFGQANYSSAKAGLIGLTRALALQWAPDIRVNVVAPGLVDTPMTAGMPEQVLSRLVERVPAQRMAEPAEIAETVAFLGSPAAAYVTGQVVLVCGGRSIAP